MMLHERGVSTDAMSFASTEAGKPYVVNGVIDPPVAFNVSHDNALVAMAFGDVTDGDAAHAPAYRLGVDVMKVELPRGETLDGFVNTFAEQLAPSERAKLTASAHASTKLEDFFRVWTFKEAYTKALGLGLGFDFARLAYDVHGKTFSVDGGDNMSRPPPRGWDVRVFKVEGPDGAYVGALARASDGDYAQEGTLREVEDDPAGEVLLRLDAAEFVAHAVEALTAKTVG